MTYASEDLMREHEGILAGLSILDRMVALLKRGTEVDSDDLKAMVEFFSLFADKCHHGKEEGLLFPAMERAGISKDGGPIGQMLAEHAEGRRLLAGMTGSLGGAFDDIRFMNAAAAYMALMRSHIEKENRVLFPMGDGMIPEDVQLRLLEQFEDHEKTVMGEGTHEKLHGLLHRLTDKYGVK
jgi:hemerythrin-like domain-containing protein